MFTLVIKTHGGFTFQRTGRKQVEQLTTLAEWEAHVKMKSPIFKVKHKTGEWVFQTANIDFMTVIPDEVENDA